MTTRRSRRSGMNSTFAIAVATMLVLTVLGTACAPEPGGTPNSSLPTITTFSAITANASSPALVVLSWEFANLGSQTASCEITSDDPAFTPVTVPSCNTRTSVNVVATATAPTTYTYSIEATASLGVVMNASKSVQVLPSIGEPFDITPSGLDTVSPQVAAAFTAAAGRWQQVIVSGFADTTTMPSWCEDTPNYTLPTSVDDLMIHVAIGAIDGENGTLASAGPDCIIMAGERGITGTVTIDTDDVDNMVSEGTLQPVLEHEIGHILGLGTLWETADWGTRHLVNGSGGTDPRYKGAAATAEWLRLGGTGYVPLEADGGSGTSESHWRETTFVTELMTGWIDSPAELSSLSVASLADLGYNVDLSAADAYSLPGAAARAMARVRSGALIEAGQARPMSTPR